MQVAKKLDRETTSSYFGSLDCTLDVNPYFITHQITVNIGESSCLLSGKKTSLYICNLYTLYICAH